MENNKNNLELRESCHTSASKEAQLSYSSPNFAQDLIDSLSNTNFEQGEPFFKPMLINSTFSPAFYDNGLFVTNFEKLSQNAWKVMLEVSK